MHMHHNNGYQVYPIITVATLATKVMHAMLAIMLWCDNILQHPFTWSVFHQLYLYPSCFPSECHGQCDSRVHVSTSHSSSYVSTHHQTNAIANVHRQESAIVLMAQNILGNGSITNCLGDLWS